MVFLPGHFLAIFIFFKAGNFLFVTVKNAWDAGHHAKAKKCCLPSILIFSAQAVEAGDIVTV